MTENTPKQPTSTREKLLIEIEKFLTKHSMKAESFGWLSIGDSSLVERLRSGGDINTRKLDKILRFLGTYRPPEAAPNT